MGINIVITTGLSNIILSKEIDNYYQVVTAVEGTNMLQSNKLKS